MSPAQRLKVYIASSLDNIPRVRELQNLLRGSGMSITYDWTAHGRVSDQDERRQIAEQELVGIFQADCILVVTPAGRGTHFEMGAAFALAKPIILLDECPHQTPISFHCLSSIIRVEDAKAAVSGLRTLRSGRL